MNVRYITTITFFSLLWAVLPVAVRAEECVNQYGQYGANCAPIELSINKEVKNPITGGYAENLSDKDATFSANGDVLFRVTVKNTSNKTFTNVRVRDVFPSFLTFVSGPGTYDKTSNTLTIDLGSMTAGSSQTFEVLARVVDASALPANQSITCMVNTVKATATEASGEKEDTAQMCVTTQVLGATTLPAAGFNDLLLVVPFALSGLGGIALLRKRG